jgi:nicotinamidase-related amidase
MTLEQIGAEMVELVPELSGHATRGKVIDKRVYSPWLDHVLANYLHQLDADTIIVSGGETEVCVLATVLGAVDRGYRTIVAADALCSSTDETHDAVMKLYQNRYGQQIESASSEEILRGWS